MVLLGCPCRKSKTDDLVWPKVEPWGPWPWDELRIGEFWGDVGVFGGVTGGLEEIGAARGLFGGVLNRTLRTGCSNDSALNRRRRSSSDSRVIWDIRFDIRRVQSRFVCCLSSWLFISVDWRVFISENSLKCCY